MRDEFSDSINSFFKEQKLIFLTGDLGFNVFENLAHMVMLINAASNKI